MATRRLDNPNGPEAARSPAGDAVPASYRRVEEAAGVRRCLDRLARIERLDPVSRTRPAQRPEALVRRTLKHLPPGLCQALAPVLARDGAPEPMVQAQRLVRLLEVVDRLTLPGQSWLARLDRALRSLAGRRADVTDDPVLAAARGALVAEAIDLSLGREPDQAVFDLHAWCIAEGIVPPDVRAFWTLDLLAGLAFDRPDLATVVGYTTQALAIAEGEGSDVPGEERVRMRRNHAEVLAHRGDPAAAFALLEVNLADASEVFSDAGEVVIDHAHRLAGLALEQGEAAAAHTYATLAVEQHARFHGIGDPGGVDVRRRFVEALRAVGRTPEALVEAQVLLGEVVASEGERSVASLEAAIELVASLTAADDLARADRVAEHWHEVARRTAGQYHPTTRWLATFLGGDG